MLWLHLLACQPEPPTSLWCDATGEAFGTTWSVKWSAPTCDAAIQGQVSAVLAEVDAQMSSWREDSELSRIRRGTGPVTVSFDTWSVVRDALGVAEASGGAFDPTVQPLMEIWGFHSKDRVVQRPTQETLEAVRAQVGFGKVRTGMGEHGPWVDAGGTALDLSAIAKGHGVDRISHHLSARGLRHHMVEVGGEVRVTGDGPRGHWSLGVDAPIGGSVPGQEFAAVIRLSNASLATSGNYRNLIDMGETKVHHTLDPRTGLPAPSDVASASILAPDCRTADAIATTVMVLGSQAGMEFVEAHSDVEALLLVVSEEGTLLQQLSSGMQPHVAAR